jgi:hypothetical protein
MQGGFLSYDLSDPAGTAPWPKIEKFRGLRTCPTFNLNGDVNGAQAFLAANIERRFVGKNVCHTIVYDKDRHRNICAVPSSNRATELFREGMDLYLQIHDSKKFHDPSAAVCHLHPEIASWFKGSLYREKGNWGTYFKEDGDDICVTLDYEVMWKYIAKGK